METVPRGTSDVILRRMEIHVHLGGEEPGNNLEGTNRRVRGRTPMSEYHDGLHLERSKGTRDQVPLHTIGTEANRDRPNQRISTSTNKILEVETGWSSVPTAHQNKCGYTVHPGIQAHE